MAKRPKSRVHQLADALDQMTKAHDNLMKIDLRTCKGEVRNHLKVAREAAATAIAETEVAMQTDVPERPKITIS